MYLARSLPGIRLHTRSKAVRAELTARSTSAGPARATSLSDSSDAGLTVVKTRPSAAGLNSPSINRPYLGAIRTTSRDSGAGAYSQAVLDEGVVAALIRRPPFAFLVPIVARAPCARDPPGRRTNLPQPLCPHRRGRAHQSPAPAVPPDPAGPTHVPTACGSRPSHPGSRPRKAMSRSLGPASGDTATGAANRGRRDEPVTVRDEISSISAASVDGIGRRCPQAREMSQP